MIDEIHTNDLAGCATKNFFRFDKKDKKEKKITELVRRLL